MPPSAEAPSMPAPSPQTPMFSPVGIVVVLLLLVIEGVGVFMIAKYLGGKGGPDTAPDSHYAEVDLGQINLEISVGDDATRLTETFMVQPVLILNPNFDNMEEVKAEVDKKKNLLRDRVHEIVMSESKKYFYGPNVFEELSLKLKKELNTLLKSKDGHDRIERVIFPQRRRPAIQ